MSDAPKDSKGAAFAVANPHHDLMAVVAQQTGAAVVITDWRGRIEWANAAFTEITGYALDEVIGRTPGTILQGPDTDASTVAHMAAALRLRRGFDVEILNYHKNGSTYWLHLKVDPIYDQEGEVTRFIGVQNDVTQRVEAQQRIDSLNQRLALAVTGSGFGVWEFDPVRNTLSWDARMYELYGHTRATFDDSPDAWRECLHPDDRALVDSRFGELLAGRHVELFEFRIRRASDGAIRHVEANGSPQFDRTGRVRRLIGMNRDVTDSKATAFALQASERRLAGLINSIDGVFWEADALTYQCLFVSPRVTDILGYTVSEWRSPNFWYEHVHPEDRDKAMSCREAHKVSLQHFRHEYRMIAADGRALWFEDIVSVIAEADVASLLRGVLVDISERKALEERLGQAEKMKVIGQLAGGVAHDFNNTLSAMMLSIELLRAGAHTAEGKPLLDDLETATKRASQLTSQLLTFARRQTMRLVTLDLNSAVGQVLQLLRRVFSPQIRIEIVAAPQELWIEADPSLIDQAVMNLCINARDAMPHGGTLTITTELVTITAQQAQQDPQLQAGNFVCFSIRDTGSGMTDAVRAHIFEPFFTTKGVGEGTGLGLASVHGTALQHRGWVSVDSTVGVGSIFRVYLPAVEEPQLVTYGQITQPPSPSRGTEMVLLVEDEHAVRKLTMTMLQRLGYRVLAASDGPHALALWRVHGHEIDLLLSDIVMPGGLTGDELAAKLRVQKPSLKVLLMTGGRINAVEPKAHVYGEILVKPFGGAQLGAAVRASLDSRSMAL